jgi:hypothetical protein
MRRIAILGGALVAVAVLAVKLRGPKLHERLMSHCDQMFERMPDTFPPKKVMRGVEEIRANTLRILDLLGDVQQRPDPPASSDVPPGMVHHAA